jgi:hypothetical protein
MESGIQRSNEADWRTSENIKSRYSIYSWYIIVGELITIVEEDGGGEERQLLFDDSGEQRLTNKKACPN